MLGLCTLMKSHYVMAGLKKKQNISILKAVVAKKNALRMRTACSSPSPPVNLTLINVSGRVRIPRADSIFIVTAFKVLTCVVTALIVIMFPSSSRVKLNRVALKDAVWQKLVPRRRRASEPPNTGTADPREQVTGAVSVPNSNEPVRSFLTEQTGPEKVTYTNSELPEGELENRVGMQKAKRKKYDQSCKDFKQEGPCTRGRYHQSKPNTRSKVKLDQLRKLCNLRLTFTWCFCTESESALLKRAQVHSRMKPRVTIKMSCVMGLSSEAAPATKGRKRSDLKSGAGSSSGKSYNFRRRDFYHKTLATRLAKSDRDRSKKGQSKGKARSTGCDPQPAAAKTGQVGTGAPSVPTGHSSKVHLRLCYFL